MKIEMPNDKTIEGLTNIFKILGDNTRVRILYCLANQ